MIGYRQPQSSDRRCLSLYSEINNDLSIAYNLFWGRWPLAGLVPAIHDLLCSAVFGERRGWPEQVPPRGPQVMRLDNTHRELDAAVVAAYGRPADIAEGDAPARLLDLNRERAAAGR